MQEGEYGRAIRDLRLALDLDPGNAEALLGLGRAYKAIADFTVAEDYFQRALDARNAFRIPDRAFLVRYERAEIYRSRRDFAAYERELFAIADEDPVPEDALIPEDLYLRIARQGLDRVLVLYRLAESPATRARGMLAELLVGLGRYNAAAEQGARAVLQSFTTLIEAAIERDPTYEFSTVRDLMARITRYPEARSYLERTTLHHDLYYLAAALWGERNDQARTLWRLLSRLEGAGVWGERAARQAADPRPEPLLVPTRE